jgi:hypothetical protein
MDRWPSVREGFYDRLSILSIKNLKIFNRWINNIDENETKSSINSIDRYHWYWSIDPSPIVPIYGLWESNPGLEINSHRVRIDPRTGHQQSSALTIELRPTRTELCRTHTELCHTHIELCRTHAELRRTHTKLRHTHQWATPHPHKIYFLKISSAASWYTLFKAGQ